MWDKTGHFSVLLHVYKGAGCNLPIPFVSLPLNQ